MSKHILKAWRFTSAVVYKSFACIYIKLARCVPQGSFFLGRCIAFAFDGMQVQQLGTLHILQLRQYAHQFYDVVPVKGAEISDIESLKDILLMTDSRFQCIAQSDDSLATVFLQIAFAVQPFRNLESQGIVGLVGV